jgi:hypothetical protein
MYITLINYYHAHDFMQTSKGLQVDFAILKRENIFTYNTWYNINTICTKTNFVWYI